MINSKDLEKFRRPKQQGLWENIVTDPGPALKIAMNDVIKACCLSRAEVVDQMNQLAMIAGITCNGRNQKVTVSTLDKWLAPGANSYHIPLRLLPIFCQSVGSNLPLKAFSTFFKDARVISEEELKKLRWAELEIKARQSRKKAGYLGKEIGL